MNYIYWIYFAVSPKTCWFKRMSLSKDTIFTLGFIGGSLAVFPFLDDQTKFFLELLMIGGQFGIQVLIYVSIKTFFFQMKNGIAKFEYTLHTKKCTHNLWIYVAVKILGIAFVAKHSWIIKTNYFSWLFGFEKMYFVVILNDIMSLI